MNRVIRTADGRLVQLRPVRLYGVSQPHVVQPHPHTQAQMMHPRAAALHASSQSAPTTPEETARQAEPQPIPSGQAYRVTSPPEHNLVTPPLAQQLSQILEQFAQANGFNAERPLDVAFGRGTLGLHRFRRAADIYAIGGKGLGQWAHEWNAAMRQAIGAPNPQERARLVAAEKARNLGYKLYTTLQAHGGWAQPPSYPVQLFGPWTRSEGPHKAISDRLLQAHRDHIHVAR
jgi:hypothetical protein